MDEEENSIDSIDIVLAACFFPLPIVGFFAGLIKPFETDVDVKLTGGFQGGLLRILVDLLLMTVVDAMFPSLGLVDLLTSNIGLVFLASDVIPLSIITFPVTYFAGSVLGTVGRAITYGISTVVNAISEQKELKRKEKREKYLELVKTYFINPEELVETKKEDKEPTIDDYKKLREECVPTAEVVTEEPKVMELK